MAIRDFKNSMYYTLFINNGSNYATYWMSSRCVNANSIDAGFNVSSVDSGKVSANGLYGSYGDTYGNSYTLRPVITLNADITIGDGNGSTTPYELGM